MRRLAALAVVTIIAVTGCATIPDDGPVREGNADVLPVQPFEPILEGPDPATDPEGIVTGFLNASAGGVATDFSVAREFLTADAAAAWDPASRVLVYDSGAVTPAWDEDAGIVSYEVPLASTLDDSGRRLDAASGEVAPLEYTVVQQESGQWRIDALPDGVVVSRANFSRFFRPVELVFASPDRTTVVPELRWLAGANAATSAARELIQGPSTWLADAVVTGFPATAALAVESVVVNDGVAAVDLTSQSAGTPEERALAVEQMRLTLTALPEVRDLDVRIGGLPMSDSVSVTLAMAPLPDASAAVMVGDRLGVWDGEELALTLPEAGGVPSDSMGMARSYDGDTVAISRPGVGIQVTTALTGSLVAAPEGVDELEPTQGTMEFSTVIAGDQLVTPSFDPAGFLWTVERSAAGGIVVAADDGESISLGEGWVQGRTAVGLAVSRDGTRLVLLSKAGGQPVLEVAAIVRDAAGVPTGLGDPFPIGTGVGAGIDVIWVDSLTVGVLGEPVDGAVSPLWLVGVGGGTDVLTTVRDAAGVTARVGSESLVVVSQEGRAEERLGTSWTTVLADVSDVAFSG